MAVWFNPIQQDGVGGGDGNDDYGGNGVGGGHASTYMPGNGWGDGILYGMADGDGEMPIYDPMREVSLVEI